MIDEMTSEVKAAIIAHALEEEPRECCGVLIAKGRKQFTRRCRNESDEPEKHWRASIADQIAAEDEGEIIATYHSHIHRPPVASEADRATAEKNKLPSIILCLPPQTWGCYLPEGWEAPLIGRPFIHGVLDCYTLMQDYFERELKIILPQYERADRWWEKTPEADLYMKNFEEAGFVQVFDGLKKHDVILMELKSTVPNHAAVYLGDGIMLHHPPDKLSGKHPYVMDSGFYAQQTRAIVRHKSFME